jgi:ABC-type branched-subunit amino acid transport system substrate-binding protein
MAPYFMNIASDEALATLYINFGADVLKAKMGWDSVVVLAEDTAFGGAITGLVTDALAPVAGIEVKDVITYDVNTVDFGPIFSKAQASGADFIYQVSSVNSQVMSSQYVKLQVPMAMTGVNVSALGMEYWEDTGGAGGGISTLSPVPSVGFELDPVSAKFVEDYQAKYTSRPSIPHFNGFNAYHGLKQAMAAAAEAGGFKDVKAWNAAMLKQDLKLEKDGKLWLRYGFWQHGEVEPVTGRTYPQNARFDLSAPYDDAQPSMVVIQWKEDGTVGVVYPFEYANTEFELPSWIKK